MKTIKVKTHKQVKVFHPKWKEYIRIDTKIAPLIEVLWSLNIDTYNSCQDNTPRNYIWIEFRTASDCEEFLNIIRPKKWFCGFYRKWKFNVNVWDHNEIYDEQEGEIIQNGPIELSLSVRFPVSDYKRVLKAVEEYIERGSNEKV